MQYQMKSHVSKNTDEEADCWVAHAAKPFNKDQKGRPYAQEKPNNKIAGNTDSLAVTMDQMKSFVAETGNNLK